MTLEWFVQQGWNGIPASSDQISGTINFGDATKKCFLKVSLFLF